MSQFLTNFSVVVVKHLVGEEGFCLGNQSFIRSEIFLSRGGQQSTFENSLFFVEIDAGQHDFRSAIEFEQSILLRHRISNKYLSYSADFEDEENDSTVRLQLSSRKCYFQVLPCFHYQVKISNKIKFGEDVYLATRFESSKLAHLTVRPHPAPNRMKPLLGMNSKSKIHFHSYFEREEKEDGYTYGQAVWLGHIESATFLLTLRPDTAKEEIAFRAVDEEERLQSIDGLWLIDSIRTDVGGRLNFKDVFRLKSLCTGRYLAFSRNYKLIDNQRIYTLSLEENPTDQSQFQFASLRDEDTPIRKGAYLIFQHAESGEYLGTRRHAHHPMNGCLPVLTFATFEDEDLFQMKELGQQEEEAVRFVFSVQKELKKLSEQLQKKKTISAYTLQDAANLYDNIIHEMKKIQQLGHIFEEIQEELGPQIPTICAQLQLFRSHFPQLPASSTSIVNPVSQLTSQFTKIYKYFYAILNILCKDYKQNQVIAYSQLEVFLVDVFKDVGCEELLAEIFRNNYSLLCKLPKVLPSMSNVNLVRRIFNGVLGGGGEKNADYWQRVDKLLDLLHVLLTFKESRIDVNQRLISTELFENSVFSRLFMDLRLQGSHIRYAHPHLRRWIDLQKSTDKDINGVVERVLELLAKLCQNRSFVSKQLIHNYLSEGNRNGVETLISYLKIPLTQALSNSLFSLLTNCYVDSSPRINRHKPLAVLHFLPNNPHPLTSRSSEEAQISGRLKDSLINQAERSYATRPLHSTTVQLEDKGMEPSLQSTQLSLYKQELSSKIKQNALSPELLRSICLLIKLESYSVEEIQQIKDLLNEKIVRRKLPKEIITGTMQIFQQIDSYCLQIELKKITTYLQYKFTSNHSHNPALPTTPNQPNITSQLLPQDVPYLLPGSPILSTPIFTNPPLLVGEASTERANNLSYINEFNSLVEVLKKLYSEQDLRKSLLELFIAEQDYSFAILNSFLGTLVRFCNPKLRVAQLLTGCIVVTQQEESSFERLFALYKRIKRLVSISEHWLCSPSSSTESADFINIITQLTNYLYEGSELGGERKSNRININRQLTVHNLAVHQIILELLRTNFYLLEGFTRKELPKKQKETFEASFLFLHCFSYHCPQNIAALAQHMDILDRFRELPEMGQTKLLILLYRQQSTLLRQLKLSMVEMVLGKITRDFNAKGNDLCEFNPLYIEFLMTMAQSQGKINRRNLQFILKAVDKESVLKKLLFMQHRGGKNQLCLDLLKFKAEPLQLPFIYHAQIFRLLALLIANLQSAGNTLKNKLKQFLPIQEILELLSQPDIYTHTGVMADLRFLLKRPLLSLFTLYLEKNDSLTKLYENDELSFLLDHYSDLFLRPREKQAIQTENEYLIMPYLDPMRPELEHDRANLKDYFLKDVRPLLLKLHAIFDKMASKEENRIFLKLDRLLHLEVGKLGEGRAASAAEGGLDKLNLKWRNYVDEDAENSKQQKYVKKSLLELLRHPQIYAQVEKERTLFYQLLLSKENKYVAVMRKLISLAIEEENAVGQSYASLENFYRNVQQLADYLTWREKQQSEVKKPQMADEKKDKDDKRGKESKEGRDGKEIKQGKQSKEGKQGKEGKEGKEGKAEEQEWTGTELIETLMGYIIRQSFNYSSEQARQIFHQVLRIFNCLLARDKQGSLLKQFYKIICDNSSCSRFFNCLRDSISEISERVQSGNHEEQVRRAMQGLFVCGQQRVGGAQRQGLRLICQLCKHLPFTTFLRGQPYASSTDFLDKIYNAFYFMMKKSTSDKLTVTVPVVDAAELMLECCLALMNGCNAENQNFLIDNKFADLVVESLKMQDIPDTRDLEEVGKRDELLAEVIAFYLANGIDVSTLLEHRINLDDYRHPYLLNRLKLTLFRVLLQCMLANPRCTTRIRLLVPPQLLKINLIWVYQDFTNEGKQYTEQGVLRQRENWDEMVKAEGEKPSQTFIMLGFYFFNLIEAAGEGEGESEEEQFANNEQKQKQKVVKKFFSSIAESKKAVEKLRGLQREPFAKEMQQYYLKYYEAYSFYQKHSATIEARVYGHLVQIHFPVLPLCQRITPKLQEKLVENAERISQDEKIKSLMEFEKETFELLQGEQDYFQRMSGRSPYLGTAVRLVTNEDDFFLFVWVVSCLITLVYLFADYEIPNHDFNSTLALHLRPASFLEGMILILSCLNLGCSSLLLLNLLLKKIPFLSQFYATRHAEEQQDGNLVLYQMQHIFSAVFFDLYAIVFSFASLLHPLFSGFLLVYIVKRISLGKQIVQAIQQTWFSLIVATALLVVFNYIYSIYIYAASYTDDIGYGTTCLTLATCLQMLLDQALKSGSGFLGTVTPEYTYQVFNIKFLSEITYILFAQKVIFEIFSGTIIDKFSELREKSEATQQDEQSNCFICGQERFAIDFELEGFDTHTQRTHNKLHYLYFLFYLRRKAAPRHDIHENFIFQAHQAQDYTWLPDDTSILKEKKDEDGQHEEKDQLEQHQQYYSKKLQEMKKVRVKVQNLIGQIKEDAPKI